jgi:hypothetical protein
MAPDEVARALLGTGLFEEAGGADHDRISLAAPFRPFVPYLRRQAARTAVAVRRLRATSHAEIPQQVWRAAALFDAGLFFECHEYLEDVWRATPGPKREFYHGLVQAAAGGYHLEKANIHGARTLIRKAIAKLEPYAPTHQGVEVGAFLVGLRRVLARLEDGVLPGGLGREAMPTLGLVDFPRARRRRPRTRGVPTALHSSAPGDAPSR